MTDGRANIALDGTANRDRAQADALSVAAALRRAGLTGVVVDAGRRPSPALAQLAASFDAPYVPMPRADAARLSTSIAVALDP